jgi:hypothetical protein
MMSEPKSTMLTISVADGVKPFLVQVAAKEDREGLWNLSSILFPQIGIEFKVNPAATGTFVAGETLAALAAAQREYLDRLKAQREEWRTRKRPKKTGDAGGIQKNPKDSPYSYSYSYSSSYSSSPSGERGGGKPPRSPAKRFTPPTVEEVEAYARDAGLRMDAARFVDHFTSNGWRVGGRAPMKDWKSAARNWARNDIGRSPSPSLPSRGAPPAQPPLNFFRDDGEV